MSTFHLVHVQLDITAGGNLTVVQEVYMYKLTLLQETTVVQEVYMYKLTLLQETN